MRDPLLTVDQVAERLNITAASVRDLLTKGGLIGINVSAGKQHIRWRVRESEVERFLNDRIVRPLPTARIPPRRRRLDNVKRFF